ncbi:neutral ceramidase precursor [Cordyceps fumosorosea ARSEF 2679]|uniref:Neutral ceramidase n=1 Tax=Cordyceps fumosorosea (strain ARSEF 2679) TaxID=1081104 RepID=A0A167MJT3_CORFA|nr:neutral ceramidase precursor [Cordyceps fumosorosea ARSEF 2679]OAA54442.1 neutral ceramidase precursor [Cordyceps fumosorosea ARSEF 2679]
MRSNSLFNALCTLLLALLFGNAAAITLRTANTTGSGDSIVDNPTLKGNSTSGQENKTAADSGKYLLGVGKADITGPIAEVALTGYANLQQIGSGLRQRLFARAFIIGDTEDPSARVVYVVLDALVGDTSVRFGVLDALSKLGDDYTAYGQDNVALAAVHSHSAPGGWNNYLTPQIPGLGFNDESYDALVAGTVLAIRRAHESLAEGRLDVGSTEIKNAAVNRSLWAYLNNPREERARYADSTDKTMTLLRFTRAADGKVTGILNWFPTHGTSLYRNNTHVAGDNKALAAWMVERHAAGQGGRYAAGFVAGFSQANLGDASPNVEGAWCEDGSGAQCHLEDATCADGTVLKCQGRGPHAGLPDFGAASCHEIATRQLNGVQRIMDGDAWTAIRGRVRSFHFFHDMAGWEFTLPGGEAARTCAAALGYSFAAGTTDGRGEFDFVQGNSGKPHNPWWNFVQDIVKKPSQDQVACHAPKPIFLSAGELTWPYAWEPNIVDMAMMRIGQLLVILSPSEVTTMSGRRWKEAVAKQAVADRIVGEEGDSSTPIVVLGSPVNVYAHYVATPEEYEVQRYEGAATLYGRHQLDAYINLTTSNVRYLRDDNPTGGEKPASGPTPPNNVRSALRLLPPPLYDTTPWGRAFGDELARPQRAYTRGETVKATFQGANPRNDLRLEDTYAAVERQKDGKWTRVRDDADWFLVFTWRKTSAVLGRSEVDIEWDTTDVEPGTHRIRYYGDAKNYGAANKGFVGTSSPFAVR